MFSQFPFTDSEIRIEKIHSHRQSFLRIIDEMAAIITVTVQLYLQIYWVSAKTGFDKRRRWPKSFPLPNFSVKVVVVEAADFRHIFPDYSKYTPLYGYSTGTRTAGGLMSSAFLS